MPERIQLQRKKDWRMPARTRAVTRPGPFGNPFIVDAKLAGAAAAKRFSERTDAELFACATADEAVERYERMLIHDESLLRIIRTELRGWNLACFCKPGDTCHADVLLRLANE